MNDMPPESLLKPCEKAARQRVNLRSENVIEAAFALFNAAECHNCTFRASDWTCRAWPPRVRADGSAAWPKVNETDWCGCWRAA